MLTDVVIANRSYTKLNVPEDQAVDHISLMVMKQDCPDFLLPIKAIEIDGELELRYELSEGIRLSYSSLKMNKKEFVTLLKNMLTPFRICGDWFLDSHNILMDANYVLVGRGGQMVRYIYLPVPEYAHSDAELMDFFWNIILKAEIEDDPRYAMNLLRVLKSDNANLMTLLDYVSKEEQGIAQPSAPVPGNIILETVTKEPSPFQTDQLAAAPQAVPEEIQKSQSQADSKDSIGSAARPGQMSKGFGKQDIEGALVGSLFGDDEEKDPIKKGKKEKTPKAHKTPKEPKPPKEKKENVLFDLFKGKNKNSSPEPVRDGRGEAAYAGTAAAQLGIRTEAVSGGWQNQEVYGEDATEIDGGEEVFDNNLLRLSLEDGAGYQCPKYIEIDLSRGFATVGRLDKNGQGQSDFNFELSLSFISRRHFRVEKAGEEWRIIDLESKNGTFINDAALLPNIPHPLRSGDRIMISAKHRLMYRVL